MEGEGGRRDHEPCSHEECTTLAAANHRLLTDERWREIGGERKGGQRERVVTNLPLTMAPRGTFIYFSIDPSRASCGRRSVVCHQRTVADHRPVWTLSETDDL